MAHRFSRYFGNYPAEYNRTVHGPYDPTRYYGPRDTPLFEVKLSELGSWLNRRNLHPGAVLQGFSRGYYRMIRRFSEPRYSSPLIFYFQLITIASITFYLVNYPKSLRHHKVMKYHW